MIADDILAFYNGLILKSKLPRGVSYMNPYQDAKAFEATTLFYRKFYNDDKPRRIVLGINPGRFGGGITGIPFTDPVNLENFCGIKNDFAKKTELSSGFIYRMIEAYGGVVSFYQDIYISALSPLGFIKEAKNLNYYDIPTLITAVEPFMIECLRRQSAFNIDTSKAFCLGEGDNFRYLVKLNERHNFFKKIVPLPHPRFIMQYKRKQLQEYIDRYISALRDY
jgi:hypothetical protein